jgi:DNA-binding PadR family transcriptional regulator
MVMQRISDAELVILGLLVEKPRHGYELERVIEERGIRRWTPLGSSSVYYLLERLQKRKLISTRSQGGLRERKSFAVSKAGREACVQASLKLICEPQPSPSSLMVAFANQPAIGSQATVDALIERRGRIIVERRHSIESARSTQAVAPPFVRAIFDYSLCLLEAEEHWIDRTITLLEAT